MYVIMDVLTALSVIFGEEGGEINTMPIICIQTHIPPNRRNVCGTRSNNSLSTKYLERHYKRQSLNTQHI